MMKSEGGESAATPALATQLNSTKGSGKSLAPDVNASMSNAFGTDFSHVRVHTDTRATQMNQDLHAKAFTHGSDIYFNQGQYAPTSSQGKKLLAHELTHVVQQSGDLIQPKLHAAHATQDSAFILNELASSENTAAMRVVIRAINQAIEKANNPEEHIKVVASGGGEQYKLHMTQKDAIDFRDNFQQFVTTRSDEADESSFYGSESDQSDPFTQAFNTEFRDILGTLRAVDPVSSREGEGVGPVSLGKMPAPRSPTLTKKELYEMFSSKSQRAKLSQYMKDHMVPDKLFGGGDLGNANVKQRILISGHILTNGKIQRGSFTQKVHARMCGHWADLVYNYAGASRRVKPHMRYSFDHEGQATMSSGTLDRVHGFKKDRTPVSNLEKPEQKWRQKPLPISEFNTLQPGDWLYIFTNINTKGGDHSVIFSHWKDETPKESNGLFYQRAVVFNQGNKKDGGTQQIKWLSEQDGKVNGRTLRTISLIQRHRPDAHTPSTVREVETGDMGVTGGKANENYIKLVNKRRRPTGKGKKIPKGTEVDVQKLIHFLQNENEVLLKQIEHDIQFTESSRFIEEQHFLYNETNTSKNIEVLTRLNEKLRNLIKWAATIGQNMKAESNRVDPRREKAKEKADVKREKLNTDIENLDKYISLLNSTYSIYETKSLENEINQIKKDKDEAIKQTRSKRKEIRQSKKEGWRGRLKSEQKRFNEEFKVLNKRLKNLKDELKEIEEKRREAIDSIGKQHKTLRVGGHKQAGKNKKKFDKYLKKLENRKVKITKDISGLDEAGGYHVSHPGKGFRDHIAITGKIEKFEPQPDWKSLTKPK